MHQESPTVAKALRYLRGESLPLGELDELWEALKNELEFGYARKVLALLNRGVQVIKPASAPANPSKTTRRKRIEQHALCTSKDVDLSAAIRHDEALEILQDGLGLTSWEPADAEDELKPETLGIAGGICKRSYEAFAQREDLEQSLHYYERGYRQGIEKDFGYTAINTAFVLDQLAALGDDTENRRRRARRIREEICEKLPPLTRADSTAWLLGEWWFHVTLAEAYLGLGDIDASVHWVEKGLQQTKPPYWEYETTARQFTALAQLLSDGSTDPIDTKPILQALVEDSGGDLDSLKVGRVGLALSGGGFRASLYHLGVLARLAELDVLRHVSVLSCVSGGSIVGALYYVALRNMLQEKADAELGTRDYIDLVEDIIKTFEDKCGLRDPSPGKMKSLWRVVKKKGALSAEDLVRNVEEQFYLPYIQGEEPLWMDRLAIAVPDHDPTWHDQGPFNPKRHNWRRANKVPALILNATTINTGHCWQFTVSSMGETPFALHKAVDSVPRLRRAWYRADTDGRPGRRVTLGQAVMASAAVPGVIEPLVLKGLYPSEGDPYDVMLVDGGVYDNEGAVGLLANECNVVLVSDAAGQLMADHSELGIWSYPGRALTVLMERIRQAGYADLASRLRGRLLRGLMFIHMKEGLYAEPIGWRGCQETYEPPPLTKLTPAGVRRDVQERLAHLRTDLDDFKKEADYVMACGYQMAKNGFTRSLATIDGLSRAEEKHTWRFDEALALITGTGENEAKEREDVLAMLERGSKVQT